VSHLEPDVIEIAAKTEPSGDVATHLASCADCRKQVKLAKGRQRLLAGLTPYTLSDVAFRRVEARLDEAVASGELEPSSWRWLGWAVAGLAAVALAFVVVAREPSSPGVFTLPGPKSVVASAPFLPLTVLRANGAQAHLGEAAWRTLAAGDVVGAGEALSAESVLLAPDSDVAWSFAVEGSLSLGGVATMTLGAGEVLAKVGAPVEVLASSLRFLSSQALFQVSRTGAEVVLQVTEGQVEVVDSVTGERRVVKAPAALRWSDGSSLKDAREESVTTLRAPQIPARPWVRFDANGLPSGTLVSLDGLKLGTAPFVELVTSGRRRLGLTPAGGVLRESWAELVGGQPFTAKVELPAVDADGREPDAQALERVMADLKRQRPKLAACYEKWLKANPTAQGEVTLELLVSAKGRVKRAKVLEGTISPASAECLVTTAKSLVLPPLGVDATLEVPLVLRSH
jgi:hypothetical protein